MVSKLELSTTIAAAVYVLIGFFLIVASIVFTKDINAFARSAEGKDGDLTLYFTKASCVYLIVAGAICMLSGSLGMVGALLEKQWSMMLYFMTLIVSLITWFVLEGVFGMITFGLTAASEATMSSTIATWELRFHCCGWKTLPADASKCAYPAAFSQGHTCIQEFNSIWNLSIAGFAVVAAFSIFAIVQMVLACTLYRYLDNLFRYSYLNNQHGDNKDE
ncbi:tetraspanin family protein [Entamoeba histolytica HM-1:IMSS-B]|uniref:Tetraspanin family protein n=9 Tax=Entamoeba TaxID=5758 RepID=C4M992_ENTH1|nr:uncharacterized protein EDI_076910 [Entamoeba dispar SAW760]XP_008860440.1 tetraspanin family protein [Entamoeba nuttalli P19]XP_648773.1 hypothetical protein EHI_075690 [Entamoeba histolytica HM-1:IMSS]EMD45710.1 tetraspanin family protein [Entamoeba histolytica KU27]EMH74695.1 tetraspanin family protein [Entamoeba histolytica HM-1:IMSS-B]EMS12891.1 tetraspanin family protein [Entamoeba histolytica HM-3:IMSS]ENY61321.1 tetraspanin family protein, putative [Entamoeba histolytica HM-1:IMSS-|eukprot:EDR25542.1 hypothetical protein EDI_076910 [Entamoeba dispar SAW760]